MESSQFPGVRASRAVSGRRNFIKIVSAVFCGTLALAAPVVSGVLVLLDPLRRKSGGGQRILVTSLSALPEDGLPRRFPVISSQSDAWNRSAAEPIGAVYLRRTGPKSVQAFNVVCPHAGCFVEYVAARRGYACPCHNSAFALDGRISDSRSPSPRGLDELRVQIVKEAEVWVEFRNFLAGHAEKVPVA